MKILATGHKGHLWVGFLILEHLLPALHGIEDRSFNALVVPARFLVFRSVAFLPFGQRCDCEASYSDQITLLPSRAGLCRGQNRASKRVSQKRLQTRNRCVW